MSARRFHILLLLLLLVSIGSVGGSADSEDASADEQMLKNAGVGTDAESLRTFFRLRTLSDADRKRIETWIRQLGSDQFKLREEASRQLVRHGVSARSFLSVARRDADAEIARRAGLALEEIDNGPGAALPTAAVHTFARLRPSDAASVLLAYLPFADDAYVEEEIFVALLTVTPDRGSIDNALTKALLDPHPLRRAAAAHVLARKGDAVQRAAVRPLLKDKDALVRWRAARGLLAARDKTAMDPLIRLLADSPLEVAAWAEETLCLLAGEQAPSVWLSGGNAVDRRKCRDAWLTWWNKHGETVDLARAADERQTLGLTLGIEYDSGRVWECGRDSKLRWEFANLSGPMEAQILPGHRVLLVESRGRHTISERDFKGKVLWEKRLDIDPSGCQRLPNGNTFISSYAKVMELGRDGKEIYSFDLPTASNAIRKHRNGHILCALDKEILELDTTGRKVRSIPLPPHAMYVGIQDLPGDRFLVANSSSGRVLELDAKGKIVWESKLAGACGVWRVPSGNTLVSGNHTVVELNRAGKKVWETSSKGYVRRVHRR